MLQTLFLAAMTCDSELKALVPRHFVPRCNQVNEQCHLPVTESRSASTLVPVPRSCSPPLIPPHEVMILSFSLFLLPLASCLPIQMQARSVRVGSCNILVAGGLEKHG